MNIPIPPKVSLRNVRQATAEQMTPDRIVNKQLGIARRFIKHWDSEEAERVTNTDVALVRSFQNQAREQFFSMLNMPHGEPSE